MQRVLRVRKRVTLMGETVTAISGICWAPDVIVHNVSSNSSISIRKDAYAVIHTLILFSPAVDPFVYALVNKNFRGKLKGMLSCSRTSSTGSTRGPHEVCRQNLTSTARTLSLQLSKYLSFFLLMLLFYISKRKCNGTTQFWEIKSGYVLAL